MSRGERATVVMEVWDVTAGTEYLRLTEVYGVYRSARQAEQDAAAAQRAADEWFTQQAPENAQLRFSYRTAPCLYPGLENLLDGLQHTTAPPA